MLNGRESNWLSSTKKLRIRQDASKVTGQFEEFRTELGYANNLGALHRYWLEDLCDQGILTR